jgi:hypothetical protein
MGIDFNFGEHIPYNSSNFLLGLLTAFIGAFFGFGFGLIIYFFTNKNLKKKEQAKLINQYKLKLKYLLFFIDAVIETANKQLEKYKEFAQTIEQSPYKIHTPKFIATYDIERLKDYSSNDLFEAYLFFKKDKDSETYRDIFICADFLLKRLNENHNANERFINEIYKYLQFVGDETDKLGLMLIEKNDAIKSENPDIYIDNPEFKYLYNFIKINQDITKEAINVERINDELLEPLIYANEFIDDLSFCSKIFKQIKLIQGKIRNIKENSLMYVKFLKDEAYNEKITIAVQKLSDSKDIIKNLVNDFDKDS